MSLTPIQITTLEDKMEGGSFFWRSMHARVCAHNNLLMLGIDDSDYDYLSRFLRGKDKNFDIMKEMTDEDVKKLELLTGPHAVAVLKMGLLRHGVSLKLRTK
jgi:hypothetical protein